MATADIGLIGLAVMGSNLALNIAEKGYTVAVHNRTASRIDDFVAEAKAEGLDGKVVPEADLAAFVKSIKSPRSIITVGMSEEAPNPKMVTTPGRMSMAARRAMILSALIGMRSSGSPSYNWPPRKASS